MRRRWSFSVVTTTLVVRFIKAEITPASVSRLEVILRIRPGWIVTFFNQCPTVVHIKSLLRMSKYWWYKIKLYVPEGLFIATT